MEEVIPFTFQELEQNVFDLAYELHQRWLHRDHGGQRMNLSGFDLTQIRFPEKAMLNGAILTRTKLAGVSIVEADFATDTFPDVDAIEHHFTRRGMPGITIQGADLSASWLTGGIFTGSNFSGANLSNAEASAATFDDCTFMDSRLSEIVAGDATFVGTDLTRADCSGASFQAAVFTGATLCQTNFENCDLRYTLDLRLDSTQVRGARFSPVPFRVWAFFVRHLGRWLFFRKLPGRFLHWLFQAYVNRDRSDPWSVLRQSYSGPRITFLVLALVAFALPYLGRALLWAAIGAAEPKAIAFVEKREGAAEQAIQKTVSAEKALAATRERLEKLPPATVPKSVQDDLRTQEESLAKIRQTAQVDLEKVKAFREGLKPRPVWKVVLKTDRGPVPTLLAILLILYNAGVYLLVTSVATLRDEEERSGYSPSWNSYRHLRWVHCGVTLLYWISLLSFFVNVSELLVVPVWLP